MTPINFCYWLQGARELCQIEPNGRQIEIIRKHLALSIHFIVENSIARNDITTFVTSLSGALRFGSVVWDSVWAELDNVFEHIDNMTPGDQAKMNSIHGGPTVRC